MSIVDWGLIDGMILIAVRTLSARFRWMRSPTVYRRSLQAAAIVVLIGASTVFAGEQIQACFSPPIEGGCDPTQTIVAAIASAQSQILVQAYSFTSAPIAKAIVDAARRGVRVQVILDKSSVGGGYSAGTFLKNSGIPVLVDSAHAIAHNKVMIIDAQTVVTGSFNFTKAAEDRNAENLVVVQDRDLSKQYIRNWNAHAAHSQALAARASKGPPAAGGTSPEESEAPAGGVGIVGNKRSHIYAWPGCASYDTMAPQNRVVFSTVKEAEAAGYRQARNCP